MYVLAKDMNRLLGVKNGSRMSISPREEQEAIRQYWNQTFAPIIAKYMELTSSKLQRRSAPESRPIPADRPARPASIRRLRYSASQHELWSACIHEAGHAVTADAFGLAVLRIQVFADGSGEALVAWESSTPDIKVAVFAAGSLAQASATNQRWDLSGTDKSEIERLTGHSAYADPTAFYDAGRVVRERWRDVVALADLLMQLPNHCLERDEIQQFFQGENQ